MSLWDLKELGGLPIFGEFYDEITPSLEEITGLDENTNMFSLLVVDLCFMPITW